MVVSYLDFIRQEMLNCAQQYDGGPGMIMCEKLGGKVVIIRRRGA